MKYLVVLFALTLSGCGSITVGGALLAVSAATGIYCAGVTEQGREAVQDLVKMGNEIIDCEKK